MSDFPDVLRSWRKARRLSQLHLAFEAGVSARHLSFLETGRARPSREMVERLGSALRLPLAARNQLLNRAGYAARYPSREWDHDEMAPIRAAVDYALERHAPYPALALDRLWRVVRMNPPAQVLFGLVHVGEGDSLLDLLTSGVLPAVMPNWPQVAHQAAQRLWTESAAQGGVPELERTARALGEAAGGTAVDTGPVVPTVFETGATRLSLFTTIAQFGTPQDIALDDLKIEFYFPADAATERALRDGLSGPS